LKMFYDGRFMILLMAIFSIYVGFIYNDCFSIPFPIFNSRWHENEEDHHTAQMVYDKEVGYGYPFGVDWKWKGTKNELIYYNSLKMKMSILLGVVQMMLGICLKFFNGIYYNKPYDIWFEFIPQFLFMSSIFGYLCVLIVIKWCTDFTGIENDAPMLLNTLIAMFLSPFSVEKPLYDGQGVIQNILVIIALVSVPFMLFPKPFLLKRDYEATHKGDLYAGFTDPLSEHETRSSALKTKAGIAHKVEDEQRGKRPSVASHSVGHSSSGTNRLGADIDAEDSSPEIDIELDLENDNDNNNNHNSHHKKAAAGAGHKAGNNKEEHHEGFDFSEIFVHQIIHTIEFVLGAVSNTASYLRLWALSLAHAQLSSVFWVRILVLGLSTSNFAAIFVIWPIWAAITLAVLMGMESISAFLHALRLHWVEFMNKFYYGDGVPFQPFNLELIVHPPEAE